MVNIDRLPFQRRAQARRQDLHVTRQHHQVDTVHIHQLDDPRFLRQLGFLRRACGQRQVVERDIVARCQLVEVHVIGHDGRNLHRQQSALVAEQQIVQAVADLRHHQHHARLVVGIAQFPVQLHLARQRAEIGPQRCIADAAVFQCEVYAHEKQARLAVAELRGVDDVAAVIGQESRHAMNDSTLVQAREGQDVFGIAHNECGCLKRWRADNTKPGIVACLSPAG